jgi:hypothetical protein
VTAYDDLRRGLDLVDRVRAEQDTPLLAVCHPVDMWTVLAQVQGARAATIANQAKRPNAWLYPPPRHIVVCPRRHAPAGKTYLIDPLVGGGFVYREETAFSYRPGDAEVRVTGSR